MLNLNLRKPLVDVESLYSGKGVKFEPSQAIAMMQRAYDRTITTKILQKQGPLYDGELEVFILDPLVNIARAYLLAKSKKGESVFSAADVTREFAARSIGYAIIDQVTQVYEVREVSKTMTNAMLKTSEIYETLKSLPGATETEEKVNAEEAQKKGSSDMGVIHFIQRFISGKVEDDVKAKTFLPLQTNIAEDQVISQLIKSGIWGPSSHEISDELSTSVIEMYQTFVQEAKRGKGMALTTKGRMQLNQRVAIVRAAIVQMFREAVYAAEPGETLQIGCNAMALGNALLSYLKMRENPDAFFPRQELAYNVIAWAGGLKQEAGELKQFWMQLATAPASFSLQLAKSLWETEAEWLSYLGEEFELMKMSRDAIDKAQERFSLIQSDFCQELASRVMSDLLKISGATRILPVHFVNDQVFQKALDATYDLLSHSKVKWTYNPDEGTDKTDPTRMFDIPYKDKLKVAEFMAQQAQAIVDGFDVVNRSAQLISLVPDDPQPLVPLVPISLSDLEWPEAQVEGGQVLTFSEPAPSSSALPVWTGASWPTEQSEMDSFVPQWALKEYQYQPVRPLRLLYERLKAQKPLMMWTTDDVPEVMGDAVSRPWGTQTVPACYTYQRNRAIRPYTMREYLLGMDRMVDGLPRTEYLLHVAETLAVYGVEDQTVKSLIDYLAPSMFVYVTQGSGGEEWVQPRLYTMYGVPMQAFQKKQVQFQNQQGKGRAAAEEVSYSVQGRPGAAATTVRFVLHSCFPEPAPVILMTQTLESGLSVVCPILENTAKAYFSAMRVSSSSADMAGDMAKAMVENYKPSHVSGWMLAGGFAPFTLWMPGTYFRVYSRIQKLTDEKMIMYSLAAAIKWRQNPVTGALDLRGFVHNPVALYDYQDRQEAYAQIDPVPGTYKTFQPSNPTEGTQEKGDPRGPQPETVASKDPNKKIEEGAAAAKVFVAADADKTEGRDIILKDGESNDSAETPKAQKPIAGDPASSDGDDFVWVVIMEGDERKLKKVKKDQVPEGASLASDEEIADWLKSHKDE